MGGASGIVPIQRLGLEGFQRAPKELAAELDAEGKPLSPYGPQAYDLEALSAKLSALASGQDIRWPVYDRARREIVPDITPVRKPIVIVEGCYLLLKSYGWENLRKFADYSVAIMAQPGSLASRTQQRLAARGLTPKEAAERYENDYRPAIMQVMTGSWPADETWIYSPDGEQEVFVVVAGTLLPSWELHFLAVAEYRCERRTVASALEYDVGSVYLLAGV